MKASSTAACAAALMISIAGAAQATLLEGETVRVQVHFPTSADVLSSQNVVVGPGAEYQSLLRSEVIDVSDMRIRFTNRRDAANFSAAFNGYSFFDALGTIDPFTSVSINPDTNLSGFDASDISFDADSIFVNFAGTTVTTATVVTLDINLARVPAPSSLLLAAIALAGLAGVRRGRKG
jgi:hypothetical protein